MFQCKKTKSKPIFFTFVFRPCSEISITGMLRCSFSENRLLESLELFFDVSALTRQLQLLALLDLKAKAPRTPPPHRAVPRIPAAVTVAAKSLSTPMGCNSETRTGSTTATPSPAFMRDFIKALDLAKKSATAVRTSGPPSTEAVQLQLMAMHLLQTDARLLTQKADVETELIGMNGRKHFGNVQSAQGEISMAPSTSAVHAPASVTPTLELMSSPSFDGGSPPNFFPQSLRECS